MCLASENKSVEKVGNSRDVNQTERRITVIELLQPTCSVREMGRSPNFSREKDLMIATPLSSTLKEGFRGIYLVDLESTKYYLLATFTTMEIVLAFS